MDQVSSSSKPIGLKLLNRIAGGHLIIHITILQSILQSSNNLKNLIFLRSLKIDIPDTSDNYLINQSGYFSPSAGAGAGMTLLVSGLLFSIGKN